MKFPQRITLFDTFALLDGGTMGISARDEKGQLVYLQVNQHSFPGTVDPGRLYYQGKIVEPRSVDEEKIIELLETAQLDTGDDEVLHCKDLSEEDHLDCLDDSRSSLIRYLQSDKYLDVCKNGVGDDRPKSWWQFWRR